MRVAASMLLLIAAVAPQAPGQTTRRESTPNETLVSPEILADKRVTFRIYAPKASEVTLRGDWMAAPGPVSLQKDERGVWSMTTDPLRPDFYGYNFTVDGVRVNDPKNPMIKLGIATNESTFFVPGEEAAFEDNRLVPHGEIRQVWYQSSTLDMQRRMHIYTPPGYDNSKERYPVFYLLHGGGDEDSGWSSIGRAGFILDNLLAAKKAKAMIVVMPNGSLPRSANADSPAALQERFTSELLKDVVPFVEKNFRVLAGREHRAIAGLSMGGGQTLRTVTSNPDKFAYVGVWSSGVREEARADFEKRNAAFLESSDKINKLVKVFSISVGDKDATASVSAKNLTELLNQRGIKNEFHMSSGGHTWINWRQYLNQYAQVLFR